MKTLEGICENGKIRIKDQADLSGTFPIYILIPDENRPTGIDPDRNARINRAKKEARKRIRSRISKRDVRQTGS